MEDPSGNKITIEEGNAEDLHISPVFTHLSAVKPKTRSASNKKIVIPEESKNKAKKKK